ncbi:MAG: hypothetical protein K6G00_08375 [Treponema sp.]|nr:hypothetical protein [Treponema sp.]
MKKVAVQVIALVLILSIFMAILFEVLHAGHEEHCHEHDCQVCLILKILKSTVKTAALHIFTAAMPVFIAVTYIINWLPVSLPANTLVAQKVKLIN